jgi:hypothetical protein
MGIVVGFDVGDASTMGVGWTNSKDGSELGTTVGLIAGAERLHPASKITRTMNIRINL